MTISSTTASVTYNGNGSTTVFAYTFRILDDDDILVQLKDTTTGVITTQTKTTDYAVSGVDATAGGNITFVTAPASGYTVILSRNVSLLQETDYTEYDSFPAQTHETALDKLTMIVQQINTKLAKAVQFDLSVTGMDVTVPTPVADSYIKFNAAGTGFELTSVLSTGTYSFPVGTGVLAQTASNVAVTRTLTGTTNQITVTNGTGVSGNPTFSIPATFAVSAITNTTLSTSSYTDSRTTTVANPITVAATTSGTAAAGIGVGILYTAKSADENPSDFGSTAFVANDVTAGSEDTLFRIFTRTAGAALAAAYDFLVTSAFKYIFTGAPTANRTVTLPNSDISQFLIQIANTQTGAVLTGTTIIPNDDTIPQITEGNEYMTLAITPKSALNILYIEVCIGMLTSSATGGIPMTTALFQDATANALAATIQFTNVATTTGFGYPVVLRHKMVAGTVSATTFRVRCGASVAGTTTFNGLLGGRYFGGVCASSITITEVSP